jgi:UDP-N-acetyl-D-galactosamine dehydrogenase
MLAPRLDQLAGFDAVLGAVPHATYRDLADAELARLVRAGGLVADLKGMWRARKLPDGLKYWTL